MKTLPRESRPDLKFSFNLKLFLKTLLFTNHLFPRKILNPTVFNQLNYSNK